jgi:hypothetical protein
MTVWRMGMTATTQQNLLFEAKFELAISLCQLQKTNIFVTFGEKRSTKFIHGSQA